MSPKPRYRKPQERRTSQSPAIQAAVTARRLNGDSKSKIARDLGIARNTVLTILSESELNDLVTEGKASVRQLIPLSVAAYRYHLEKKRSHHVATKVLEGTGVLETHTEPQAVDQTVRFVIIDPSHRPPRPAANGSGELPATNGDSNGTPL